MKDSNHKTQTKAARKAAADKIEHEVLKALKQTTSKFKSTEKFADLLEKSAKKLAKKISKEITFEKEPEAAQPAKIQPKAKAAEPVAKPEVTTTKEPAKKTTAKPAAKQPSKPAGKAAPKA